MTSFDSNSTPVEASSTDSSAEADADASEERKPFVAPQIRRESDLVDGTADRHFFGTSSVGS